MTIDISFKKDYGMDTETLMAQIRAWRIAGYSDEEIQEELERLERDPEEEKGADKDANL